VYLEIHQRVHAVFLGKSLYRAITVSLDALREIARYADVQRAVGFVGQYGRRPVASHGEQRA
jgi:hypothetical protein